MTLDELAAELGCCGFWQRCRVPGPAGKARLDALDALLSEDKQTWARLGPRFKPASRLTEEDRRLLRDWSDALNEDLERILLGEAHGTRGRTAGAGHAVV
jgi:hypothetical protein